MQIKSLIYHCEF